MAETEKVEISREELEHLREKAKKAEKAERKMKVTASKQQLEAKWAREHKCLLTTEHVEMWIDMDLGERRKYKKVDDFIKHANVVIEEANKKGTGSLAEQHTHNQEPSA